MKVFPVNLNTNTAVTSFSGRKAKKESAQIQQIPASSDNYRLDSHSARNLALASLILAQTLSMTTPAMAYNSVENSALVAADVSNVQETSDAQVVMPAKCIEIYEGKNNGMLLEKTFDSLWYMPISENIYKYDKETGEKEFIGSFDEEKNSNQFYDVPSAKVFVDCYGKELATTNAEFSDAPVAASRRTGERKYNGDGHDWLDTTYGTDGNKKLELFRHGHYEPIEYEDGSMSYPGRTVLKDLARMEYNSKGQPSRFVLYDNDGSIKAIGLGWDSQNETFIRQIILKGNKNADIWQIYEKMSASMADSDLVFETLYDENGEKFLDAPYLQTVYDIN